MTTFDVAMFVGSLRKGAFSRRVAIALPPIRMYR